MPESDFFSSYLGQERPPVWERRRLGRLTDSVYDIALAMSNANAQMDQWADSLPRRRVLITGVRVEKRAADMDKVVASLARSRHDLQTSIVDMGNAGKFDNINRAIAAAGDIRQFDWLVITDDDIEMTSRGLDRALALCERADIKIAQPAHRFFSYSTYGLTRRHFGSLVRLVRFVEIGPLTFVHRDCFADLLPFPTLRWAWGLDLLWAKLALDHNWRLAVLDGVSLSHMRPVANSYNSEAACIEGRDFLRDRGVQLSRRDVMGRGQVVTTAWG